MLKAHEAYERSLESKPKHVRWLKEQLAAVVEESIDYSIKQGKTEAVIPLTTEETVNNEIIRDLVSNGYKITTTSKDRLTVSWGQNVA